MKLLNHFDQKTTLLIQDLPAPWIDIMKNVSFLGEPIVVLVIAGSGYISAVQKHQKPIQTAFVYAVVAFLLSTILKYILRRARPDNLDIRTLGIRSYSFPSGHAFGTVVFYGLFSYLDLKYLTHPWNWLISLGLWIIVVLIGISRVYLKFHYPSDVLAGWLLGGASLVMIIQLAF